MSSLHDFVHHKLGEDPGSQSFDVRIPDIMPEDMPAAPPVSGSIDSNRKANDARFSGSLKGDLYYSRQEAQSTVNGREESPQTVRDKVIEKEIFPLG